MTEVSSFTHSGTRVSNPPLRWCARASLLHLSFDKPTSSLLAHPPTIESLATVPTSGAPVQTDLVITASLDCPWPFHLVHHVHAHHG